MNNTSNSFVSGIDPASFSAVTGPSQDLFRFVNGPWVDMYRLPDDRSRYGSFDKLAEKYSDDPSKAPHVNGALTIGENIGDLSGVNIALKAYAFALDEAAGRGKDGSTEAIEAALADAPEIDGFTGLQRFFLSYASIWRTKNRDELAEQYLQIDPHSPAECRTNGIARNVDLFHKAFGVQPGDGMWLAPEQRVRIW